MAKPIKMPKLSDQMTEGRIAEWAKREGDEVKPGDVLAQVETEKATLDVEAFDGGVLIGIVVKAGESAPVGEPIAWLGARGEAVPSAGGERAARAAPDAAREKRAGGEISQPSTQASPEPVALRPDAASRETPPHPGPVPRGAGEREEPGPDPRGRGAGEREGPRPERGARAAPSQTVARTAGERVVASPAARKVARERGVDLATVEGSGPGGRIVLSDVERPEAPPAPATPAPAQAQAQAQAPAPERARPAALAPGTPPPGTEAPAPAAPPRARPAPGRRALPPRAELRDETLPLSPMRRAIARNLAAVKPGAPHFYLETSVDARRLVALREQLADLERGPVSVNDLVVKAVAEALARHPEVNAAWGADAIVRRGSVDVGVAVALDEGLVTPVVRGADRKDVFAVAAEVRDLAARARARRLRPEEYQGGSFTVSNLGMFGVEHFFAVINPPEAAILAVGAIMKVPWVDEATGAVVAVERMRLGLSCDHRVVDGATGARYLQTLKAILEAPVRLVLP